jgi:hypothetical protein
LETSGSSVGTAGKLEEGRPAGCCCREGEEEVEGRGGFSGEGRLMLEESVVGGLGRGGKAAAALGTGRHRRRWRWRQGGREGRKEVLEMEAGGGGRVPAEGLSIGVHRHPAREAWGSPEKIWRGREQQLISGGCSSSQFQQQQEEVDTHTLLCVHQVVSFF